MPKVSVIIPFYNREEYVGQAIDSILQQSFTDFEIVAVDDGSTDNGAGIVGNYRDGRVRLIGNKCNRGISFTRNHGIAEARGEYSAFLDSDDLAHPHRLKWQVDFLDAHPDHAAVGGWFKRTDMAGKPTGKIKRKPTATDQVAAERLFRTSIVNGAAMGRTSILREYPQSEDLKVSEDFDLWARIGAHYHLAALPLPLILRREHDAQTTRAESRTGRYGIFSAQLQDLGLPFTQTDVQRHFSLRRINKVDWAPDDEFLDWAEQWLQKLRRANAEKRIYPEPEFSAVLGELWFRVCKNTHPSLGLRASSRFFKSPLCRPALISARQHLVEVVTDTLWARRLRRQVKK